MLIIARWVSLMAVMCSFQALKLYLISVIEKKMFFGSCDSDRSYAHAPNLCAVVFFSV